MMISLTFVLNTPAHGGQTVAPASVQTDDANAEKTTAAHASSPPATSVVLSPEGKAKSADDQKYADIDAAKIPDSIKKYLKAIRDLQEKIDKKSKELQAVMQDQSLSPAAREVKAKSLQLELAVLTSTLSAVTSDMMREMSTEGLKGPERQTVGQLMMPK